MNALIVIVVALVILAAAGEVVRVGFRRRPGRWSHALGDAGATYNHYAGYDDSATLFPADSAEGDGDDAPDPADARDAGADENCDWYNRA